jgi:hypothetical protein
MPQRKDQVQIQLYRLEHWPWWVRQYLRQTFSRPAAILFCQLASAFTIGFAAASKWYPIAALMAAVCLQGAVFIYLATRWVDRNSIWDC